MGGIEDEPPTKEQIAAIRQRVRDHLDENGEEECDPRDINKIFTDDYWVSRFYMHGYDEPTDQSDIAVTMIKETLKFRKQMDVNSLTADTVKDSIKERGNLFIHNKDKDGKTLLVFSVKNHRRGEENMDDMKRCFLYYLERIERTTGGDKLSLVFDCAGCGLKNMDMELIQYMINVFKFNYPHVLNYILVLEMPWVLNAAWKVIKSWLPAAAVKKIKFLTKSNLNEYVTPDQALVAWGGTDDWEYSFEEEGEAKMSDVVNGDGVDNHNRPKTLQFPLEDEAAGADDEDAANPVANGGSGRKSVRFNAAAAENGGVATPDTSFASSSPSSKSRASAAVSSSSFSDVVAQSPVSSPASSFINSTGSGGSNSILTLNPSVEVIFEVSTATNSLVAKVQITNTSTKTVIFKIKTTSPEKYRVRPSLSHIKTGDVCDVEIHLHPSQLSDPNAQLEPGTLTADVLNSILTTEASASLLKDKFLITAITIPAAADDNAAPDDFSQTKLTELMKSTTPEVQLRLKCGISGLNKVSSQMLRNSSVGDKMPTTSTLQNANKQLETLSKKVNTLQGVVSELQETIVSFKKLSLLLVGILILMQLLLLYYIPSSYPSSSSLPVSAGSAALPETEQVPPPAVENQEL